jgi:hypothetical protein
VIGIYKITNKVTGKYYIGQSGRLEGRLSSHKKIAFMESHSQYNDELYKDIREYGIENFKFEILETVDLTTLEEKWIQQEYQKSNNIYNKNLYPHSDPGCQTRIFNDEEITEIILLLKENKLSNIQISKKFNCSSTTIDNINNGTTYVQDNQEYPIRTYAKGVGERNANSMFSDNEVIELRKRYVSKSIRQLYEESSKAMCYHSFERMIIGMTYNHLPVYKKREKCWYLGDDITVINEKLKTDKYANLSNAEIAEALTEIGISIDMNNFKIHDGQIVSR